MILIDSSCKKESDHCALTKQRLHAHYVPYAILWGKSEDTMCVVSPFANFTGCLGTGM